jgi:hypothetical protein
MAVAPVQWAMARGHTVGKNIGYQMDAEATRHSGTGLIYEMVLVKKLTLEASGHECRMQFS